VPDQLPVSIVIPTIGRLQQLRACLASIAECSPRAAEVVLVDQSGASDVTALAEEFAHIGARVLPCAGRGISIGMNAGLREAAHEVVLVTHDDCTVGPDWVDVAARLIDDHAEMIVTGRVLPAGDDPLAVPSTKDDPAPHDFTGELEAGALYPNNMALTRSPALALGGFDERFKSAAEDNEFSYRWLRAGKPLRYEPELVVWHNDWRSRDELERLYTDYWRWQGVFYAKHLRSRDLTMLRFIVRDVKYGAQAMAERLRRGRPRWSDWRRGVLRGLPAGLLQGWRMFGEPPG
jgi:GT2 family glycosyltransferase